MEQPHAQPPPLPGLIVFADWYDVDLVKKAAFYDDNTRSWWQAATGGRGGGRLQGKLGCLFVSDTS